LPRRSRRGPGAKVIVLVHGGPGLSLTYLKIFNRPASPAEQIGLFCMPQLADAECPRADQIEPSLLSSGLLAAGSGSAGARAGPGAVGW
jgi:hypothetical protein